MVAAILLFVLASCAPSAVDPDILYISRPAEVGYGIGAGALDCAGADSVSIRADIDGAHVECAWLCATWDDARAGTNALRAWLLIFEQPHEPAGSGPWELVESRALDDEEPGYLCDLAD